MDLGQIGYPRAPPDIPYSDLQLVLDIALGNYSAFSSVRGLLVLSHIRKSAAGYKEGTFLNVGITRSNNLIGRPLTAQEWQSLKSCILPVLDGNCEFTQEWKNKWIPYVSSLGAEFGWDKCPNQLPKPKENMARPSSKGFNNAEKSRMEWNGILYLVLDKVPGGKLEFRTLCYVCIVLCPKLLRDSQKEGDTPTILVKRINSSARHSLSSHNEFVQEGKLWKIATIEGQEKKVELRKGKKESGLPPNAMRGMQISQVAESDSAARPSITFNQPPTESSKRKREDADRVANNHDASPKRKVLKTKTLPKTASDKSQSPTSDSAASQSNASQQPHKGLASTRPTFANGRHPLPGFPHYEQAKTPWGPNAEEEATGASRLEVAPSSETQNHNDGEPNLGTQRPRSCTPEQIEAIEALVHLARAHDEDDPVPSTLPRPRQMLAVEEIVGNRELLSMGGNWREPAVYTPNRTPSIQEERANRNGFRPNPQQEYHGKVRKKRDPNLRMPYGFAFDLPSLEVQINPLLSLSLEVQRALGMYQPCQNVREKNRLTCTFPGIKPSTSKPGSKRIRKPRKRLGA